MENSLSSRDEYVEVLKSSFVAIGKRILMQQAIKALPFLSLPFLSPILGMVVGWALGKLVKEAEIGVFFIYTDIRVGHQSKDFVLAAYENYTAQQSGTKEEKENAEKKLLEQSRIFISLKS